MSVDAGGRAGLELDTAPELTPGGTSFHRADLGVVRIDLRGIKVHIRHFGGTTSAGPRSATRPQAEAYALRIGARGEPPERPLVFAGLLGGAPKRTRAGHRGVEPLRGVGVGRGAPDRLGEIGGAGEFGPPRPTEARPSARHAAAA